MTIYISQFWCGVLATLGVELLLFITFCFITIDIKGGKKNGKGKDNNNQSDEQSKC